MLLAHLLVASRPSYVASKLFIHSQYGKSKYGNDVGIIRLGTAVTGITPWTYAKTDTLTNVAECTEYTVIGHGQTCSGNCVSETLLKTTLPKVDRSDCVQTRPSFDYVQGEWPSSDVGSDTCLGHVPPCSAVYTTAVSHVCGGDSGGPLFDAAGTVVGVVSRGSARSCSANVKPDIFTNIGTTSNAAWISTTIASAYVPPSPPPPPKPPITSSGPIFIFASGGARASVRRLAFLFVLALAIL